MAFFSRKRSSENSDQAKLRAEGQAQLKRLQRLNKVSILTQLKAMDPIVFEHFVGAVFERQGFSASATVASADEGVDLILRKGLLKAVVQCKRYGDSVGQPVVRDLYGTMLHNQAKESYLVTTAMITSQARAWARGKPIHLVDGYKLVDWIAESKTSSWRQRYVGFFGVLLLMVIIFNAYLYWPVAILERAVSSFSDSISSLFAGGESLPVYSPVGPGANTELPMVAPATAVPTAIPQTTISEPLPVPLDADVQIFFPSVNKHAE